MPTRKGVWKPTDFNAYGTAMVPVQKATHPEQKKARIMVCRDYSVIINQQLETHRQPIPLLEDLITAQATIQHLKTIFDQLGLPEKVLSGNGPTLSAGNLRISCIRMGLSM